jgi:hypothetical protein
MKITITLKDPDGVYDAVHDAVMNEVEQFEGLYPEEQAELIESRTERIFEDLSPFIVYGEYISVEIDTDTQQARVLREDDFQTYPYAGIIRHRDNLVVLKVGTVLANSVLSATNEAIGLLKSIVSENPLLKTVELVNVGAPI